MTSQNSTPSGQSAPAMPADHRVRLSKGIRGHAYFGYGTEPTNQVEGNEPAQQRQTAKALVPIGKLIVEKKSEVIATTVAILCADWNSTSRKLRTIRNTARLTSKPSPSINAKSKPERNDVTDQLPADSPVIPRL